MINEPQSYHKILNLELFFLCKNVSFRIKNNNTVLSHPHQTLKKSAKLLVTTSLKTQLILNYQKLSNGNDMHNVFIFYQRIFWECR